MSERPGTSVLASWPRAALTLLAILVLAAAATVLAPGARAETASSALRSYQGGLIDVGGSETCAIVIGGALRCWGQGFFGSLGYGNTRDIGDDETPDTVGPVDLGPGRTARAVAVGAFSHACAILDNGSVRCWGEGFFGELGYGGNIFHVGDDETPAAVAPVDLGPGRTARAITAGGHHTCVIVDDGRVRCWGNGQQGAVGLGIAERIGDDELPRDTRSEERRVGKECRL